VRTGSDILIRDTTNEPDAEAEPPSRTIISMPLARRQRHRIGAHRRMRARILPCDCDSSPRGPGMSTQVRSDKRTALQLADRVRTIVITLPCSDVDSTWYSATRHSQPSTKCVRIEDKGVGGTTAAPTPSHPSQTTPNVVRDAVVRRCRHTYTLMQGARHVGSRGDVEAYSTAALSCVPQPPGNDACRVNRLHLAPCHHCSCDNRRFSFVIGLTSLHLCRRSHWCHP